MSRVVLSVVALGGVYLLVLASREPWDVALGVVAGALLVGGCRGFVFGGRPRGVPGLGRRVVAFVPFAVAALRDVVVGTWRVALTVLRVRPLREPGIVAVPLGERTVLGVAVSALVLSLSPGEVLVDIDWEGGRMLVHALDASDPEAVRGQIGEFYRRYQRHVFP